MLRSLFFASVFCAGVFAQSTPDPALTRNGTYQHVGCVAIRPGTFPRQFDLGQAGCTSSCSVNGNIIGFHENSCVCDRLDLSPKPVVYRVVKVDDALCNVWCDPADRSKGTCGGATIPQGWPIYDLYKRNNAQIVFEAFPGVITPTPQPTQPVQTLIPVPNPTQTIVVPAPNPRPGDVWHECPPTVVNCPYRKKCPSGGCQPVVQPCRGCSWNGTGNWTAPSCPPGGCKGPKPVPVPDYGSNGGDGGNGDNGGSGGSGSSEGSGSPSGNGGSNGGDSSGANGNGGNGGNGGTGSPSGNGGDSSGGDSSGASGGGGGGGGNGGQSPPVIVNSAVKAHSGSILLTFAAISLAFTLL
ncbi:hypothetical protein F53441_3833 [Fusarium austroafricanum]|uniref:WSC domain-containing protein n=1 Tax=Fusarium austroafricanum TaxID=2364996 RepID=A0A8H4KLK7_9HYPO|nr:hypothetical protein F53441_3833 [Fusarium austroafricanum]